MKMGKRTVDHESNFETPTNKKRKLDNFNETVVTPSASELSFVLTTETVDGVVLSDLCGKKWRCGKPIGKGSFGEIFLASDDILKPVTSENAKYVVKIEPHKSGPLFVEIHCLLKAGKATDEKPLPLGMPSYIASGGHYFGDVRYRFLILPRYDCDLHSLIKDRRVDTKNILVIADQLLDILEHLHDNGYAHSDIKAENIMISRCSYPKKSTDSTTTTAGVVTKTATNATTTAAAAAAAKNARSKQTVVLVASRKNNTKSIQEQTNAAGKRSTRGRRRIISSSESEAASDQASEQNDDSKSASESEYEQDEESDEESDDMDDASEGVDEDEDDDSVVDESENDDDIIVSEDDDSDSSSVQHVRKRKPSKAARSSKPSSGWDNSIVSRPSRVRKTINYCDGDSDGEGTGSRNLGRYDQDDDWESKHVKRLFSPTKSEQAPFTNGRKGGKVSRRLPDTSDEDSSDSEPLMPPRVEPVEMIHEDRVHLIDFGLALKFVDSNGTHRPFVMDQRRAHDGTLEFTSRDAHMGAHSRRSDLECLAYNLIYWHEGYLPWKSEKLMTQPEQVHRMKEFFMTDVKQLYKKIYGVAIPTYINDFLTHVTNLAYHDRPNYKLCKDIFMKEFVRLGHKKTDMVLNVSELEKLKDMPKISPADIENNIIGQKLLDMTKMMKLGMVLPFCESPTSKNRISPKNLRSKTDKNTKKRRKNFSWTEILSTDPDQIARQRAEKEFERDQTLDQTPVSHRYTGNPTYAILEVENNKTKSKIDSKESDTQKNENTIKGYTKPMMDVWRKRQLMLMQQFQINGKGRKKLANCVTNDALHKINTATATATNETLSSTTTTTTTTTTAAASTVTAVAVTAHAGTQNTITDTVPSKNPDRKPTSTNNKLRRRKNGLRCVIKPPKKLIEKQRDEVPKQKKATATITNTIAAKDSRQNIDEGYSGTDYNSSSSSSSTSSNSNGDTSEASNSSLGATDTSRNNSKYNGSCGMPSPISEGDSHDTTDFSPIQTRRGRARKIEISDEDSRDTTDYSPVKRTKRKSKTGKTKRRRSDQKSKKGIGKRCTSPTIRAFSRG